MGAIASTGESTNANTRQAALDAIRAAKGRLDGQRATFGFVFAGPNHDLALALKTARHECSSADIVGCTTAGEFTEHGLTHGGIAIMLVAASATTRTAFTIGLRGHPKEAAAELLEGLADARRIATGRDHRHLTTVLLTDGLAGTGEQLVHDVYDGRVQSGSKVVGGAAGDEGAFKSTFVGAGERASRDSAAALHIFTESAWGVGVGHGLRSTTKQMRVTKAQENVVYELDGEPAFAAYKRHAATRGIDLAPESAGTYLIANELGIHFFEKISRARAPLSANSDGSLTCAAEIPRGAMVSILDGDPLSMIEAARTAAREARTQLQGGGAAGVLLFDCVCRGMILKEQFHREIEAVHAVFPDVPVAGFLTYGEIARDHEKHDGWHNTTAVVVAIPS